MVDRVRAPRFRWLVPSIAINAVPDSLDRLGAGSADRGAAWALLIGVAAGAFWYWSYPRPLAERLAPAAFGGLVVIAIIVVGGLDGGGSESSYGGHGSSLLTMIAVLCALVLSERVDHWRRDFLDESALLAEQDRRATGVDQPN